MNHYSYHYYDTRSGKYCLRTTRYAYQLSDDRWYFSYRLTKPDKTVLFEGDQYSIGWRRAFTPAQIAKDILGFLTVHFWDTDDEYFKDYTPEQLCWVDSPDREDLSYYTLED